MPIIKQTTEGTMNAGMLPDQFVSETEKQSNKYIKQTLDYLGVIAHAAVAQNNRTFVHTYNLVKGILRKEDFFIRDNPVTSSFMDTLLKDVDLPDHVQHYSILNSPLSIMMGEQSKRPDFVKVKAYDDDSKNDELQFKTEIMKQFIIQEAKDKIISQLAMAGGEPEQDEVERLTMERVEEYLTTYTSLAERWANRVLTAMKAEFNFKEISEECFRDLLISSREFFHVFEDNTATGFGVENLNPKNVWFLTSSDKKYTSDQSGREQGAYAAGTLRVMELSEIIQRYNLPKEEIDHLRNSKKEFPSLGIRPSNINSSQTGPNTIKYDTFSPLIEQERLLGEAWQLGDIHAVNSFLGDNPQVTSYDNKFVVIESYHIAKKKIGLVTYLDEFGDEQSTFVDESYEEIPNQIDIEWTYTNQWYKGLKIGHEVYHLQPFKLLDYCPIIGVVHDIKNVTEAKSFVDLLKNFQTIYNICINQIFKLLEKEFGNTLVTALSSTPIPKDGDPQDALEIMEEELRRRGVLHVDDSPEKYKGPSAFNQWKNLDLTRTNEIRSRWELARVIKEEAWELVGISRARTGAIAATQTATGTQTELTQSYAQTEPYFTQHEYVVAQVYQALIDAAQYIATQKPEHTISLVSTEGEQAFLRINTDDLKMRDLKVFVTSRAEDQRMFEELRQLSQAMLQNGASIYDVAVLYTTNSVRQMKDTFKILKEKQEQFQSQAQQLEQQKIDQENQAVQMQIQAAAEEKDKQRAFDGYNKELDRLSNERKAIIMATGFGKVESEDLNSDAVPDVLEASRLVMEHEANRDKRAAQQQEMMQRQKELLDKNDLEREKLKVARENMENDKEIAQIQARAAAKKAAKNKTKKK